MLEHDPIEKQWGIFYLHPPDDGQILTTFNLSNFIKSFYLITITKRLNHRITH
jgi:hypothetical protein